MRKCVQKEIITKYEEKIYIKNKKKIFFIVRLNGFRHFSKYLALLSACFIHLLNQIYIKLEI